jgi:hypothetical protein
VRPGRRQGPPRGQPGGQVGGASGSGRGRYLSSRAPGPSPFNVASPFATHIRPLGCRRPTSRPCHVERKEWGNCILRTTVNPPQRSHTLISVLLSSWHGAQGEDDHVLRPPQALIRPQRRRPKPQAATTAAAPAAPRFPRLLLVLRCAAVTAGTARRRRQRQRHAALPKAATTPRAPRHSAAGARGAGQQPRRGGGCGRGGREVGTGRGRCRGGAADGTRAQRRSRLRGRAPFGKGGGSGDGGHSRAPASVIASAAAAAGGAGPAPICRRTPSPVAVHRTVGLATWPQPATTATRAPFAGFRAHGLA